LLQDAVVWRGSPNGFSYFEYNYKFAPRVKLYELGKVGGQRAILTIRPGYLA
jgi:hypothetical protein